MYPLMFLLYLSELVRPLTTVSLDITLVNSWGHCFVVVLLFQHHKTVSEYGA